MTPRQKKQNDARINRLYAQRCHGIVIPMMSIGKIFKVGEDALLSGKDDQAIGDALYEAARSVAVSKR